MMRSSLRSDGSAALDDHADDDVGNVAARALDDLGALVEQACAPAATSAARRANQGAKELVEQRKTIHEQQRLVVSLRSDIAVCGQSLLRSEDKRRGLEGELADLRVKLREVEGKAARADARAGRAVARASGALADKELAIHRGEDAVRRAEQRHARELASEREARAAEREKHAKDVAERDRALDELLAQQAKVLAEQETAHRSEVAACERVVVLATSHIEDLEALLVVEREAVAASVAAHARALCTANENLRRALAERDHAHLVDSRAQAHAQRKELAELCAKAEEAGKARAATAHARVATTLTSRLRDAEQSLAESRAKHARERTDLKLQVAGLRESTAAERRLAQHAIEMHARARAELADVSRALGVAEREAAKREAARDEAQANLDRFMACSRDTLDESGIRLACGQGDEEEEEEEEPTETDRQVLRFG